MNALNVSLQSIRKASRYLIGLNEIHINQTIQALAKSIQEQSELILDANQKDLEKMSPDDPKYDRLKLTKERLVGISDDLNQVAALPSPLGKVIESRDMSNGLQITKVSVPIGVIGIIYEARPNVTFDVFALCFKSGNACILKGGGDAHHSNREIVKLIRKVLVDQGIDPQIIELLPTDRSATEELLGAVDYVDLIIPRGSQQLIDFVREKSKVPVIETGAGIVHTYFDNSADLKKGMDIVFNAKTRRVSVCNALDCLIVHRKRLPDLPKLVEALSMKNVIIYADSDAYHALKEKYPDPLLKKSEDEHYGIEFLDFKMSIRTVAHMEQALDHIDRYSSRHSEAIIAEDASAIDEFLNRVDAAAVYANVSTAFTDGSQFGLGAEIGISTQKLHARGPMALKELTSYKWLIRGDGLVRDP